MERKQGERIMVGKPGNVRVKDLIAALQEFNPETAVMQSCENCAHGASGKPFVIADFTHQTFGYIDIGVNKDWSEKPCQR